jgi:hypothetical protein
VSGRCFPGGATDLLGKDTMLRIHFTADDLARTSLAAEPDEL